MMGRLPRGSLDLDDVADRLTQLEPVVLDAGRIAEFRSRVDTLKVTATERALALVAIVNNETSLGLKALHKLTGVPRSALERGIREGRQVLAEAGRNRDGSVRVAMFRRPTTSPRPSTVGRMGSTLGSLPRPTGPGNRIGGRSG